MTTVRLGDGGLVGTGRMIALVLRRDRLRIPLWILGITVVTIASAAMLRSTYDTPTLVRQYVTVADDNPALVVFAGPGHGFDAPSIGVILVNEVLLWCAIATALMSAFALTRHTRAEEESERADLLRSSVVGRFAPLVAAIVVAVTMNVVVAAVLGAGFIALGYATGGSVAISASIGLAGIVFVGITAVVVQLVDSGRAAVGWASGALGIAFAVRAVGDVRQDGASWLSPLGWTMEIRAFARERWWTLGLSGALALGLVLVALHLSTQRDLGTGLLPPHGGPDRAARWILHPVGLALRLQRLAIIGWSTGLLLCGVVFGAVGNDVEKLIRNSPDLARYLELLGGASVTDAYFATSFRMMALLTAGFGLSSALRARTEELDGRVEPVLAGATSRRRWWLGQSSVTAGGIFVLTCAGGIGVGVAYGIVIGDPGQVTRMLGAALVTVPAVLVVVGIAHVLLGLLPRFALTVWSMYTAIVVIGIFADTLKIPAWVRRLSPLEHVPALPARGLTATPMIVLSLVALAFAGAGIIGFTRRDIGRS